MIIEMIQNPYQKFMQQTVTTMTPAELLIALYDKAILELNKGVLYIEQNDIQKAHSSIRRASDIVDALDGSLKVKYEITDHLANMYKYFRKELTRANIKKDAAIVKELIPMFTEIRDAFVEASKSA